VQWETMDHTYRVCYGAKWLQSGERKLVKLKQNVQIWVSKGVRLKPSPRDHKDKKCRPMETPDGRARSFGIWQPCPAVDIERMEYEWWRLMALSGRRGGFEPWERRLWRMGREARSLQSGRTMFQHASRAGRHLARENDSGTRGNA
jgi:hypothetical protein